MTLYKVWITYSNGDKEELTYEYGRVDAGILHLYEARTGGSPVTRSIPLTSIRHYDTQRLQ